MSSYQPAPEYTMNEEEYDAQGNSQVKSPLKANPKYIQLQRVESNIMEFNLLKIYLSIIVLCALGKLIYDFTIPRQTDVTIDIAIRVIQLLGYGYGIQAHHTKVRWQWQAFIVYMILSFGIIGYYAYYTYQDKAWFQFGFDITNFFFNVFIVYLTIQFDQRLKERDELLKQLREEQKLGDLRQQLAP